MTIHLNRTIDDNYVEKGLDRKQKLITLNTIQYNTDNLSIKFYLSYKCKIPDRS